MSIFIILIIVVTKIKYFNTYFTKHLPIYLYC